MKNDAGMPYYIRVAETLKGRIVSGIYQPGDIISSEKELIKEFGVSNITIRKAFDLLVQEGYVIRRRGIGTRVVYNDEDRLAIKLTGNFKDWFFSASGKYPKLDVEVLEISVIDGPEWVKNILRLPPGAKVWHMKRIRKFKKEPISYILNYTRPEIFKQFTKKVFERSTVFEALQKLCGIQISKVVQRVEAIIADLDVSSVLGVRYGEPLFSGKHIYYDQNLFPIEVTNVYYRGDRYIYKAITRLDEKREDHSTKPDPPTK